MDQEKFQRMKAGGHKLAQVRDQLLESAQAGVTLQSLEDLANQLIGKTGGEAAFKKVPGYNWATCLNVNEVVVHGIPSGYILKDGDLLSLDIGLYYQGYYTDTTASKVIGKPTKEQLKFLEVGQTALNAGIRAAKKGNRVSDISRAIQTIIESHGLTVIRELTGHGIGKKLHEDPYIPNFVQDGADSLLTLGQTIAIEPMYTAGKGRIKFSKDGWTIRTADGSPASQVEHTIYIGKKGPIILTK